MIFIFSTRKFVFDPDQVEKKAVAPNAVYNFVCCNFPMKGNNLINLEIYKTNFVFIFDQQFGQICGQKYVI